MVSRLRASADEGKKMTGTSLDCKAARITLAALGDALWLACVCARYLLEHLRFGGGGGSGSGSGIMHPVSDPFWTSTRMECS